MELSCFDKDLTVTENIFEAIGLVIDKYKFENDLFYLVDLKDVCFKHHNWIRCMPKVRPFFAIKSNSDPVILKLLAALGAGVDAASAREIEQALEAGFSADRMIFANPCKAKSSLEYARKHGIKRMTFDSDFELLKIKELYPEAEIVLRILTDDSQALSPLSKKFGASMDQAKELIDLALSKELSLNLIGISFHVGSNQMSNDAFARPIKEARELFDYAREKHNWRMHLLDIGGGFLGEIEDMPHFEKTANSIHQLLNVYFPEDVFNELNRDTEPLTIIAEPGRYYGGSAVTVCTSVIGKKSLPLKEQSDESNGTVQQKEFIYYLNDGVWGTFNAVFTEGFIVEPLISPAYRADSSLRQFKTDFVGGTCDGYDRIRNGVYCPELKMGDYVAFRNQGAYGVVLFTDFNGIPRPKMVYVSPLAFSLSPELYEQSIKALCTLRFSS